MTTSEDYAWAAGFFDGEGCFTSNVANTNRTRYLRFAVTQKRPELLEQMRAILGVGAIHAYPARRSSSAGFRLQTSGRKAFACATLLWPWLGEQKKADFKRHLALIRESRAQLIQRPQRAAPERALALKLFESEMPRKEIAVALDVPCETIFRWTKEGGSDR